MLAILPFLFGQKSDYHTKMQESEAPTMERQQRGWKNLKEVRRFGSRSCQTTLMRLIAEFILSPWPCFIKLPPLSFAIKSALFLRQTHARPFSSKLQNDGLYP